MSRASRRDWCAAGLTLLREEGVDAVTVDRLCAALGKTKGSFYHHFPDVQAFHAALLARWEEELTEAPIRAAERGADAAGRAARLDRAVSGLDHRLDAAVRAWGHRDARARAAVDRVDARRVAYIAALYRASGRADARLLAELEYTAFVGAQHRGLFASPARAARLSRAFRDAIAGLGRARRSRATRRRSPST